jgi:hypothetical protein
MSDEGRDEMRNTRLLACLLAAFSVVALLSTAAHSTVPAHARAGNPLCIANRCPK